MNWLKLQVWKMDVPMKPQCRHRLVVVGGGGSSGCGQCVVVFEVDLQLDQKSGNRPTNKQVGEWICAAKNIIRVNWISLSIRAPTHKMNPWTNCHLSAHDNIITYWKNIAHDNHSTAQSWGPGTGHGKNPTPIHFLINPIGVLVSLTEHYNTYPSSSSPVRSFRCRRRPLEALWWSSSPLF